MKKILSALFIIGFATSAQAVVVTESAPVVPAADITRVENIPSYHNTYYSKGKLTDVNRGAQQICFDKTNRRVSCSTLPANTPATPAAAPAGTAAKPASTNEAARPDIGANVMRQNVQAPVPQRQPNQYESQPEIHNQYEQ